MGMRQTLRRIREIRAGAAAAVIAAAAAAVSIAPSCSDELYTGEMKTNMRPSIELTNGPLEGDTTKYRVHFYWLGEDADGTIDHYEFCLVEGDPLGFDPADTAGAWARTALTDSVFSVMADEHDGDVEINESLYGKFQKTHTFFIRAVDDRGARSRTEYRSFTAFTLAPQAVITYPYYPNPEGSAQMVSRIVTFKWYGKDPIESPWNYQEVDSTRYLWTDFTADIVRDLNMFPERFERLWSKWHSYDAPGDSGRQTTLGDDEVMATNKSYILAVQAMDEAGAVTTVFDRTSNVRYFIPMTPTGPLVRVRERFLGDFSFIGTNITTKRVSVPPGFEINFGWTGDASHYGGEIASFRYGWDIVEPGDPSQWDVFPSPHITSAQAKTFYSGVHTFYIESVDNLGMKTLGTIEITVIPAVMSRELLMVDDFPSYDFMPQIYAFPTESEQDEFWTGLCLLIKDFDPVQDIYDVQDNDFYLPPMELLWKYKNVIWNFSTSTNREMPSTWNRLVNYFPEGDYGPGRTLNINYLTYFLAFGGHLWTAGEGHRNGSLAAVLSAEVFPNYIKCEVFGPSDGCENTTGEQTMAWKDMCVTVLDKIEGVFQTWVPRRLPERDAMHHAVLDGSDPLVASIEGLPSRLDLWEMVTRPGHFFDPSIRGFHYVELYDTDYYMSMVGRTSQPCFHPMYRSVTMNTKSMLNDQAVAFWHSRYAHLSGCAGCVAAPSVHFGFPLWFFDRSQCDSLASAIFRTWGIPLLSEAETRARRLEYFPEIRDHGGAAPKDEPE